MTYLPTLPTPRLIIDEAKLRANIARMQGQCDANGVALWPHIKTHKCLEIARMQLDAGASGLVCAKLGEAEVMLASGVRRIFLAYQLVDPETQAGRLRALADALDTLIVAATSFVQAEALGRVLDRAGITLPVLMAVDTGLGREGVRGLQSAQATAAVIQAHPRMRLMGLYSHEGQAYSEGVDRQMAAQHCVESLAAVRDAIDPALTLWPGCSVTADLAAALPGVHAVRPGTYVFGDLWLSRLTGQMSIAETALSVLTTVVDRPEPGLAFVDGGSKSFSSDKTPEGVFASPADERDFHITRVSEEHGWVTGRQVNELQIGDRVAWTPAHVCPVVNLADTLTVVNEGIVTSEWKVAARGKVS
ncbi:MAG: alanine racemase [Capsulimonadaceae bacterium]|nr:alanine racemase [Capsulimonadaceae bacterium]